MRAAPPPAAHGAPAPRTGPAVGLLLVGTFLAAPALLHAVIPAPALQTVGVRGTIERFDDESYVIRTRDGSRLKLTLAPNAAVAAAVKSAASAIRRGDYVSVVGMPQPGSQRAVEVHILPASMHGSGEGRWPWDGRPLSTMTNATVEAIERAGDGHALTVRYGARERKRIVVPPGTPTFTYVPGSASELKPGVMIFVPVGARQSDWILEAQCVMITTSAVPAQ